MDFQRFNKAERITTEGGRFEKKQHCSSYWSYRWKLS